MLAECQNCMWVEDRHTLLPARVLILELGQVVYILVHDDPQAVRLAVRCNIVWGKSLGHVDGLQQFGTKLDKGTRNNVQ